MEDEAIGSQLYIMLAVCLNSGLEIKIRPNSTQEEVGERVKMQYKELEL